MAEVDIARPVVEWLRAEGWEVYQEVSMGYADTTCDIVATSGSLLWAIEVKRSKTLALVDQARAWAGQANLVSVATPRTRRRPTFRLKHASTWDWLCDYWGIGQFEVGDYGLGGPSTWPKLRRKVLPELRDALCDAQQTECEAGSARGGYVTPFRQTTQQLVELVRSQPGICLVEAVGQIGHHYASERGARASLSARIRDGVIQGIELREGKGRALELWPSVSTEEASA